MRKQILSFSTPGSFFSFGDVVLAESLWGQRFGCYAIMSLLDLILWDLQHSFSTLFSQAHFDSKGIVEEYLHTKKPKEKLNSTIVRFPGYFDNFITRPRRLDENIFVYDIPMEEAPVDAIDVKQGGECVYGE